LAIPYRFLCGSARNIEQNDQRIRMQLPQRRHTLAAFEFFKLGVDSGHARDQANQRASDIRAKALFLEESGVIGVGLRRVSVRLKKRMGTIWRYLGSATRTKTRMDSSTRRKLAFLH